MPGGTLPYLERSLCHLVPSERDGKSKRTGSDWNTPNSGEAIMSASVFLLLLRTF